MLRTSILIAALVAGPALAQDDSRLAAAQAAAWGRAGSTTYRIDDSNVSFSGGRLLDTRFGPVLVAEGQVKEFGHVTPGRIGAFYLKRTGSGFARGKAYERAVTTGSNGRVGEWSVSAAFAANPVIFAEGGMSNMGTTCSFATLTELTPAGPVEVAKFQTYLGGMGPGAAETEGKIGEIVRGKSFTVTYTGAKPGKVRFVRAGARYRAVGAAPLTGC